MKKLLLLLAPIAGFSLILAGGWRRKPLRFCIVLLPSAMEVLRMSIWSQVSSECRGARLRPGIMQTGALTSVEAPADSVRGNSTSPVRLVAELESFVS